MSFLNKLISLLDFLFSQFNLFEFFVLKSLNVFSSEAFILSQKSMSFLIFLMAARLFRHSKGNLPLKHVSNAV